jgi:hypothetical protein
MGRAGRFEVYVLDARFGQLLAEVLGSYSHFPVSYNTGRGDCVLPILVPATGSSLPT